MSHTTLTPRQRDRVIVNLEALRPRTDDDLHRFVHRVLGMTVPRRALIDGNDAPFDYLKHAFFEPDAAPTPPAPPSDLVVWANRGGGKTMLGAVATLLDLLFKPGIRVRILGGSREQSSRMFEHLRDFVKRPVITPLLASPVTQQRIELVNGSVAEISSQSQQSVRGIRVQKLRCDEVELFDDEVWQAAQLTTRSETCGPVHVQGSIEAISTMHEPGGLMSRLVQRNHVKVLRWSAIDTIERCPPSRLCDDCVLHADCQGRARHAAGFIPVQDLVHQWNRTSNRTWDAEMMCRRPSTANQVYPDFDPAIHVTSATGAPRHPAHAPSETRRGKPVIVAGLDFGLRNPLVMLWARFYPDPRGDPRLGRLEIFDEHHQQGLTLDQHLKKIRGHPWPRPQWIGVDPAGLARNSQTGLSDVAVLRAAGYRIRAVASPLPQGIERIRRRLDRGTLHIHPRCRNLIRALNQYRYPRHQPESEHPVKDGSDHPCDALRYLVNSLELTSPPVRIRHY